MSSSHKHDFPRRHLRPRAAFYTVADRHHFVGLSGLVNSLRLVGHDEPIFVLDCGLTDEHRALLRPHATLVPAPRDAHPAVLKAVIPLSHPADVMILLDADVIVVRPLGVLVDAASRGQVVTFANDVDRYRSEWGPLLGFGPLPRRRYVNSGHFLLPFDPGLALLSEFDEGGQAVGLTRSLIRGGPPRLSSVEDPFYYTDQDVLNAVFAARLSDDALLVLEPDLAPFPPFCGVRGDPATLRCSKADGTVPYLLHHVLEKPWLSALPESVYSVLLRRLLADDDVAMRVPAHLVPLRLRRGLLGSVDQIRASVQAFVRARTRGRLRLRSRIEALIAARRRRVVPEPPPHATAGT